MADAACVRGRVRPCVLFVAVPTAVLVLAGSAWSQDLTLKNGDFGGAVEGLWKKEAGTGSTFGFSRDAALGHNAPGSLKTYVTTKADQACRVEQLLSGNMQTGVDTMAWEGYAYSETAIKGSEKKLQLKIYSIADDWNHARTVSLFPDLPAKTWTFFSIPFSRWVYYYVCIDMHAVCTFWFDDMKIAPMGATYAKPALRSSPRARGASTAPSSAYDIRGRALRAGDRGVAGGCRVQAGMGACDGAAVVVR